VAVNVESTARSPVVSRQEISVIAVALAALLVVGIYVIGMGSAPPQEAGDPTSLTVMTYNIHQGLDNSGKIDPRLILANIKKADPDILGLQESETNRLISGNYDVVRWLARRLDYHHYYGPGTRELIYGVSIMSRYPLRKGVVVDLESVRDRRVLVTSMVEVGGREVAVDVVHLGLSAEDRFNQTLWLLEKRIRTVDGPYILMGDFNTTEDADFVSPVPPIDVGDGWHGQRMKEFNRIEKEIDTKGISVRALEAGFRGLSDYALHSARDSWRSMNPGNRRGFTWFDTREALGVPRENLDPPVRIDYIFVSDHFEILESRIIENRDSMLASDHLPVVSVLSLE
jgi:endonuclease/exonuclease/phosphatase family metal-dependent hydrolase